MVVDKAQCDLDHCLECKFMKTGIILHKLVVIIYFNGRLYKTLPLQGDLKLVKLGIQGLIFVNWPLREGPGM